MKKKTKKSNVSKEIVALSREEKEEVVLEWLLNGGALEGERVSKLRLAELIDVTVTDLNERIQILERRSREAFTSAGSTRNYIIGVIQRVVEQMSADRGRVVAHNDQIEAEIRKTKALIEQIEAEVSKPEKKGDFRKRVALIKQLERYRNDWIRQGWLKTESLKLLFASTEGFVKILNMFSKRAKPVEDEGDEGGGGQDPGAESEALTYKRAVELISENTESPLPRQNAPKKVSARNPDEGFEEFEEPEE